MVDSEICEDFTMQIDFHHTVTYVLARIAGFAHEEATIVAHAAQYVDDAQNRGIILFDNGHTYDHIASSHSVIDVLHNLSNVEDYQVWVPFHFLPGNNGQPAGQGKDVSIKQRMLCQPDSFVAADLCRAALATKGTPNALHRLGITTHVYGDTWAHQRFCGFKDHLNKVQDESQEGFSERFEAFAAEIASLGHGDVSVHPDQPFRSWKYRDSNNNEVSRSNPDIFVQACDRIVEFLMAYRGDGGTQVQMLPQDRELLSNSLRGLDSEDAETRHQQWLHLLQHGGFSFNALAGEQVVDLQYVPKGIGSWKYEALGTQASTDYKGQIFPYKESFETSNWKLFHDALKAHQAEILNRLLPKYGLPNSPEDLINSAL
jgi:hypothetical protein